MIRCMVVGGLMDLVLLLAGAGVVHFYLIVRDHLRARRV